MNGRYVILILTPNVSPTIPRQVVMCHTDNWDSVVSIVSRTKQHKMAFAVFDGDTNISHKFDKPDISGTTNSRALARDS